MRRAHAAVLALTILLGLASARGARPEQAATATPRPPGGVETAVAAVERFHAALAAGDRAAALDLLTRDVVVFESGGAELSRDEYATHHLGPDMEFAQATRTEVVDRQVRERGEVAWVLTRSRTTGRFREREVNAETVETMVLRRGGTSWTIDHIHWSSRAPRSGR